MKGTIGIDMGFAEFDRFDPDIFARQCALLDVEYVQIPLGQNRGDYSAPNETCKKILHDFYRNDDFYNEKVSKRDCSVTAQ